MEFEYAEYHYSLRAVVDEEGGAAGCELYRWFGRTEPQRVARVLYWDATGHYSLETFGTDVVLPVLEKLIAETKALVKI